MTAKERAITRPIPHPPQVECDRDGGCVLPWFVVITVANQEVAAYNSILKLGMRAYLPMMVKRRTMLKSGRPVILNGNRVEEQVLRPYFPGYQFAQFDVRSPTWPDIWRTPGVSGILSVTGDRYTPSPLPEGFVTSLMARGRAGDGAIDPRAEEFPVAAFKVGAEVTIKSGPFADFRAMVDWSDADRVKVLLDVFGRSTRVEYDVSQVSL